MKKINLKGITVEAVINIALLALALINAVLQMFGINTLPIEDTDISAIISGVFVVVTALYNTWKNRNLSTASQIAQEVTDAIKNGEILADDIKMALVPVSKKSASVFKSVNILLKCIFESAVESNVISYNPTRFLAAKGGGVPKKDKEALTDEQARRLIETCRGLPPYVFVMLGLYAGLRREEILALKWECVFLDTDAPFLSVRRAWHTENNQPVILTELKTRAAHRNIPCPPRLVEALKEAKNKCNPVLLEPIMKVDVTTPEEYFGNVMGDLTSRRGKPLGQETQGNAIKLSAMVPLSEMFGYATNLRSNTQGRATFVMFPDHYEEVLKNIAEEIIKKSGN